MGNIRGYKKIGRHGTAIKAAIPLIQAAERSPLVTKIRLGMIVAKTGLNCGDKRIKFTELPAGLKVVIRGRTSLQEIWVYTTASNREAVKKLLTHFF